MNILIVCNYGKNRSGYLASYLKQKGYVVKTGGVYQESENPIAQATVDWSQVIIFVQPETKKIFLEHFKTTTQKLITLDVEDRAEILAPDKKGLAGDEWLALQQERVYPELEKQINQYLPFE